MDEKTKHGTARRRCAAALLAALLFAAPAVVSAQAQTGPNAAEEVALAEFIAAKTGADVPYGVRLAMAAALLNRLADARYPATVSAILAAEDYRAARHGAAFESARSAVRAATEGMDITNGASAWARAGTRAAAQIYPHLHIAGWVFGEARR